jgi:UDP-N-acetylmuramate: L-alanyl-gamma-D-glutamyl-meso-diaminopimelate ligase
MVGAQLEGYDCMVKLTDSSPFMILEGDEYLSSPIDRRPKFHLYKPHAAIISGIAWDHINVFPTFENYVEQFKIFCECIEPNGTLIYNNEDTEVKKIGEAFKNKINTVAYNTPNYVVTDTGTKVEFDGSWYSLQIFGAHNLQNLMGAMRLSVEIGIKPNQFLDAMVDFKGAGKRLQKVVESDSFVMYKDFAHSPSKLMATTKAVKEQYPDRKLVACMELHTFSSLKKEFLPLYQNTMDKADYALVYFNPHVVAHKKLEPITIEQVKNAFGKSVNVVNQTKDVLQFINSFNFENKVLLMMSSGTFDGINYDVLGQELKNKK